MLRLGLLLWLLAAPVEISIIPAVATDSVSKDADDPAIWENPADPEKSLIVATNKVAAPDGALVVFGLDGKTRQTVSNLDRPNNVDIEYGLAGKIDIAVATERLGQRLLVYQIDGKGLREIGRIPVFEGQAGKNAAPMGIGLYKRPKDGVIFAIASRKFGPIKGYLWQYRLELGTDGKVTGTKVREFGAFSASKEIEAVAVDDELGFVYYADEDFGIHKWTADPDAPGADHEVSVLGQKIFAQNREGIAIYAGPHGTGYVVCTDQIPGGSNYYVYRRSGNQTAPVAVLHGPADATDGLDATATLKTREFPAGFLIAMNSKDRNFLLFPWPLAKLPLR